MYKINELAKMAGITSRTLRYYDKLDILKPSKVLSNGYRVYTSEEVDKLQTILFYKELGYDLNSIKAAVSDKNFNINHSLHSHLDQLLLKKDRIDSLIDLVMNTIESNERNDNMDDNKKFEAFKEKLIDDNEKKYGDELQDKYDSNTIDQSYDKLRKKSKWEMQEQEKLNDRLNEAIINAVNSKDPNSDESVLMCELHKEWIMFYWPKYSKESHLGLVKMYVEDERFTAYYDKIIKNSASFMYEAMKLYLK